MDKHLYYRIMLPTAVLALLIFLMPRIPVRSIFGFLVMLSGLGFYYYSLYKSKISEQQERKFNR